MRLVELETGREIKDGDEVELGRRTYNLSGRDPKAGIVFLFDADRDGSPFHVKPSAIGAKFAA